MTGTTVLSTLNESISTDDVIEIHFQNNKIKNPLTTGMYTVKINTYDSVGTLIESGVADIAISGQDVALNVNLQEALIISIDTGAIVLNLDPDVQFGQNWVGTGGAVTQKNTISVSTNNGGGYALYVSLSGNTATGSAVLDGLNGTGNQILTGDAKNTENRFGWALNDLASSVNPFGSASAPVSTGIGSSGRVENDENNIFYYLNLDYRQSSDIYRGTITYTII